MKRFPLVGRFYAGSILLVSSCALIACGQKDFTEPQKADLLPPVLSDSGLADRYFLADPGCQSGSGAQTIQQSTIHTWTGAGLSSESRTLRGVSSTVSLATPSISVTYFGLDQTTNCSRDSQGRDDCDGTATVNVGARPLKICTNGANFSRTSIEGVALNSVQGIGDGFSFYGSLVGRITLTKTSLLVLPRIARVTPGTTEAPAPRTQLTTDNLAYSPTFIGEPAIVIYPKSRDVAALGLWRNVNLWEIPWALAHEFGHHVLRTHTGITNTTKPATGVLQSLLELPGAPIFETHLDADGLALTAATRVVGMKEHYGAINEGFADLFAHYTYGARSNGLDGLDCFVKSRDISSAEFVDGRSKTLDTATLETFLLATRISPPSACQGPDLQGIHSIGAIVARGVDRVFAGRAAEPSGRAALLLRWADGLKEFLSRAKPADVTVERLVAVAVRVATSDGRALTAGQCESLRQVFPVYARNWLDGNNASFACME